MANAIHRSKLSGPILARLPCNLGGNGRPIHLHTVPTGREGCRRRAGGDVHDQSYGLTVVVAALPGQHECHRVTLFRRPGPDPSGQTLAGQFDGSASDGLRLVVDSKADASNHGLSAIVDTGGGLEGTERKRNPCRPRESRLRSQSGAAIKPSTETGTSSLLFTSVLISNDYICFFLRLLLQPNNQSICPICISNNPLLSWVLITTYRNSCFRFFTPVSYDKSDIE